MDTTPAVKVSFPCNRFMTSWPYRDEEFETTADGAPQGSEFARLVDISSQLISTSYGWLANRAAKVYYEAYALNATIDAQG